MKYIRVGFKIASQILVVFLLLVTSCCQTLELLSPPQFVQIFNDSKIKVVSSPIGLKPQSGVLHGRIMLAQPLNACTDVQQIEADNSEDIFLLVDDTGCLESIKANHIATSGASIGLIKRNMSTTLHDKQQKLVHIPILQLPPQSWSLISNWLVKNPTSQLVSISSFNPDTPKKQISLQLWLSPTKQQAYEYILELQKIITNLQEYIDFYPRYVLHSQTTRKQYVGCFSTGRYCAPELEFDGRPEGAKVVAEALRQIIIAQKGISQWFKYVGYYNQICLKGFAAKLWKDQNSQLCSESVMRSSDIDAMAVMDEYKGSFAGPRPQVDNNIYLQQQRQVYVQQQITKFPIVLLNNKAYPISQQSGSQLQIRLCNMIHPNPQNQPKQCKQIINPPLFTTGQLFIIISLGIIIFVAIMWSCKRFIYFRMKMEMRGEVQTTLQQYYRYMDTFDHPDSRGVPQTQPSGQQKEVELAQM